MSTIRKVHVAVFVALIVADVALIALGAVLLGVALFVMQAGIAYFAVRRRVSES